MHSVLIGLAVTIACAVRLWNPKQASAHQGYAALGVFLLPPLLLLTTAFAVLWMGMDGAMMGIPAGWMGDLLAVGFLGFAAVQLLRLSWEGWRSLQEVRTYPLTALELEPTQPTNGRILETPALFAAQVGFWRSELVVSRGLLATLTPEHLQAVLTHEQAHAYYHDTFWFFWLGWLRRITNWLPHTESLWEELLLLRELRADRWAAQQVDALLIAESLLLIVQSSAVSPSVCAAFNADLTLSRLEERIEALLNDAPSLERKWRSWLWLGLVLLPLLTVPFHG